MSIRKPSIYQTSYQLSCEVLRRILGEVVESLPGDRGGRCSVAWRACAALYFLLLDHPVDRRGRCRSCRRPGAVLGWPHRRCQVRIMAGYWFAGYPDWLAGLQGAEDHQRIERLFAGGSDQVPIHPLRLVAELARFADPDPVLIADGDAWGEMCLPHPPS